MTQRTAEEVRKLRERGIVDVGVWYAQFGLSRPKKHKFWDGWVPPDER